MRSTNQKKKSKVERGLLLKRIFLLILAALMVLGSAYYVVYFSFINVNAAEAETVEYLYDENQKLRIGLLYDSGVVSSFNIKATYGFTYGYVKSNEYYPIVSNEQASVTATVDGNVKYSSGTYSATGTEDSAVIGGYHVQLTFEDATNFEGRFASCREILKSINVTCFPAYINGEPAIRIGAVTNESAANELLLKVTEILGLSTFPGTVSIAAPSATAVTIINPENNTIIYEYDNTSGSGNDFGMKAIQKEGSATAYIVSPAKNSYSGVFIFARYNSLISLANLVSLEEYVEGVVPFEIGTTWPDDAQKAFSIAARSYAISKRGRHTSLGFDLCSTICCQVYRGCGKTTDNIRENVKATEGMVMVSGGKVASTFYSSSTGGCTVSNADAWGSSESAYPYLKAKATPWEKYETHSSGSWTVTFTPAELAAQLRNKGYTDITGNIKSVVINSLGKNSSYVSSITFTDVNGNSVTIKRSDNIRINLGLKSANFVVGKAGETVTVTDMTLDGYEELVNAYAGVKAVSEDNIQPIDNTLEDFFNDFINSGNDSEEDAEEAPKTVTILTKDGIVKVEDSVVTTVMTGKGTAEFNNSFNVITANNVPSTPTVTFGEALLKLETIATTREIVLEGNEGDFVFVGRGYGHGVGLSQWGVHDLAVDGADYQTIAKVYYPGASIQHYRTITK